MKKFVPGAVDLGTGVKWAIFNVGATSKTDVGKYFAWGETTSKSVYDESGYSYTTEKDFLPLEADAARAYMGGDWRFPTNAEFTAITSGLNSTVEWTTVGGVNGCLITSRVPGYEGSEVKHQGALCAYWGADIVPGGYAYSFNYGENNYSTDNYRYRGLTVRAVIEY